MGTNWIAAALRIISLEGSQRRAMAIEGVPSRSEQSTVALQIWAANQQDGTISVLDTVEKKVIDTLNANVRSANRLKFTPDGLLVLVSTLGAPELVILDAKTRREVKRVKIGRGGDPDAARP